MDNGRIREDEEAARRLAADLHREEMSSRASKSSDVCFLLLLSITDHLHYILTVGG